MKRIVIALVLFSVVISTSFVTSFLAEKAIDNSCTALENCIQADKNKLPDTLKIKGAIEVWDYNKKFLFAIMFHDEISEIENRIIELEYFSDTSDSEEISEIIFSITKMINGLREEFNVSFENVF